MRSEKQRFHSSRGWIDPFCVTAWAFLVTVKNPPAMQETRVWSLGQEDLVEKGMVTLSSISCLENPLNREEPGLGSQIATNKHTLRQFVVKLRVLLGWCTLTDIPSLECSCPKTISLNLIKPPELTSSLSERRWKKLPLGRNKQIQKVGYILRQLAWGF